jgi:hypothetical protein
VRVPAQVFYHVFGTGKRLFGKYYPLRGGHFFLNT